MKMIRGVWIIFQKDVLVEFKTREVFSSMFVFALLILTLFNFAFEPTSQEAAELIPGLLWIAYTFSGILSLNRTLSIEKENSGFEFLVTSPISPESIFLGKALTNFTLVTLNELLLLPFVTIFFNLNFLPHLHQILLINMLGTLGFCIIGTLFSTLALNTKMRDMLLPILLFPVSVPVLIGSIECTDLILKSEWTLQSPWFKLLVAYDVIFFTVSIMIFQYVLEE